MADCRIISDEIFLKFFLHREKFLLDIPIKSRTYPIINFAYLMQFLWDKTYTICDQIIDLSIGHDKFFSVYGLFTEPRDVRD